MAAFVIGIGGGSASGKSTIAQELSKRLAPLSVRVINQDRYFWDGPRLPRHSNTPGSRTWPDHNHPESFDLDRLYCDVCAAREGSADVVILEGILVLWDPRIRDLMDLKLFVEADADERIVRRIRRNVARGHDLDGICDFYLDSVRYRHREFCEPTRAYADIVIPGGKDEGEQAERALADAVGQVKTRVLGGHGYARPTENAAS
jgi:uridine kinase